MMSLSISTPDVEGIYQGSKWQKVPILCDGEELQALFTKLDPFWIFPLTGIVEGTPISQQKFLDEYSRWISQLQQGMIPSDSDLRKLLAAVFVSDLEALWLQPVAKGYLVKIRKPVVQVQAHFFTYSTEDGVFRSMTMGKESIFWGLQFSFPQIYQDPKTMELKKVAEEGTLFRKIQLWARENSRATPFSVRETQVNSPIRIGKKCLSWVHRHSQLVAQGIGVRT